MLEKYGITTTNEKARKILISQIMREQALERKNKSPQASWEVITIIFRNNAGQQNHFVCFPPI